MAKPLVDDELWAAVQPLLPKRGPRSLHLPSLLLENWLELGTSPLVYCPAGGFVCLDLSDADSVLAGFWFVSQRWWRLLRVWRG